MAADEALVVGGGLRLGWFGGIAHNDYHTNTRRLYTYHSSIRKNSPASTAYFQSSRGCLPVSPAWIASAPICTAGRGSMLLSSTSSRFTAKRWTPFSHSAR